jgi:hypothetical protein
MTVGKIPCPFVYAKGKPCSGHIIRVEAYRADLEWSVNDTGEWRLTVSGPRSHYHLFCSEKGNHAGYRRQDDSQLKYYFSQMPDELLRAMSNAKLG